MDTLQGIAHWRLLEERLRVSVLQTEAALTWLIEQGFIVELRPVGLRDSLFRLNPKRLKDARQFLAAVEKKKTRKARSKESRKK